MLFSEQVLNEYQKTITKAYQQASKENDCGLVMVGEAWKLAKTLRPDIKLFTSDGSHPTDLGAFLTACVFASTFSGEIPEKLPKRYFITDSNGEKVMLFNENPLDIIFCLKVLLNL